MNRPTGIFLLHLILRFFLRSFAKSKILFKTPTFLPLNQLTAEDEF